MTDEKMIEAEQGAALAAEFSMSFYETSAKTGLNVQLVFSSLAQKVKDKREALLAVNLQIAGGGGGGQMSQAPPQT